MEQRKYQRLIKRDILSGGELERFARVASDSGVDLGELLISRGIPRHEVLFCLKEHYGVPFVEYDESVTASYFLTMHLDMEQLKNRLWFPRSARDGRAEVIACRPRDPAVVDDIRTTLKVEQIDFLVVLPSDLIRIIEHNFDVNPFFPKTAGRTPLAKVRTYLAERRSMLACYRTSLAKGRTGLAFLRTGISFIAIALVLFRVFGVGYLMIADGLLLIAGTVMTIDGIRWYLPARAIGKKPVVCTPTEPTGGTTVLEASNPGDATTFTRSAEVPGARELRRGWSRLSPVMRRRFLASDRTDLAEERTTLAGYRTIMARARTGLSFTRTGIACIGLGIALFRQFRAAGPWTILDAALVLTGAIMVGEGFTWYLPGRRAGAAGLRAVKAAWNKASVWSMTMRRMFDGRDPGQAPLSVPHVKGFASPGIWATTGVALERTLLAERRNVMARLRTVMARSRTGLAFIRTGMSVSAVGAGLLVYFGAANVFWAAFDALLIAAGILLIIDGLLWHLPAERSRKEFPYCFNDLEVAVPDYGRPTDMWKRAVFSHDDL